MNKDKMELEESKEILNKFINNEMQRDKLERDFRCGGWKIGDVYKNLELDQAIKTVLQALDKEKYFNKIHGYHMKYNFIPKKKIKDILKELKEKKKYKTKSELPPHTFGISQTSITPYHEVISMITIDEVEKMLEELLEGK